jgi:DNA repair protein RadC
LSKIRWPAEHQENQLAYLLSRSIGRAKANGIARDLMAEFHTLPDILSASRYRLLRIAGVTPAIVDYLKTLQETAEMLAMERVGKTRPNLSGWSALIDYLHVQCAHAAVEECHVLYLDKKSGLISDEVHSRGTVDNCPVYPREIIKRALELGATALIVAHNHPSGDPSPSAADIRTTKELAEAAKVLDIVLHDHIIIGKSGHISLRGRKLI